jgi:hypothetical protein
MSKFSARHGLPWCAQGHILVSRQSVQKVTKVAKVKGQSTGRTYTSKYRGVHQTFPTKRWEAQFRCVHEPET